MTRTALLLASAATLAATVGCGDGHDYPKGFAEKAALDEKAYLAAEAAKAKSPASDPRATAKQSASQTAAAAPAPSAPAASATQDTPVAVDSPASDEPAVADGAALGRNAVEAVAAELQLPAPPPVVAAEGEAPYQKLARDRKFDAFRHKAARYVQLKKQLLPLGRKLADGTATPAERALHNRLEDAIAVEFKPLNAYLWDSRWTEADRAAMGWILFVKPD